jgi:hypothetical protein
LHHGSPDHHSAPVIAAEHPVAILLHMNSMLNLDDFGKYTPFITLENRASYLSV